MNHMSDTSHALLMTTFVGVGATLVMDAWSLLRKHVLGVPPLDYALVGRWLIYLPRGRFHHHPIGATPTAAGERGLGWLAHYLIGIAFAALLLALCGTRWATRPTLLPALIVGLGTVLLSFFVLQPAMGAGVAASRAPRPWLARMHSLVTHGTFGVGMYLSGYLWSLL